jgi:hypothetical protein
MEQRMEKRIEQRAQGTEKALPKQMGDLQSTVAGLENKIARQLQAQFDAQLGVLTRLLAAKGSTPDSESESTAAARLLAPEEMADI